MPNNLFLSIQMLINMFMNIYHLSKYTFLAKSEMQMLIIMFMNIYLSGNARHTQLTVYNNIQTAM